MHVEFPWLFTYFLIDAPAQSAETKHISFIAFLFPAIFSSLYCSVLLVSVGKNTCNRCLDLGKKNKRAIIKKGIGLENRVAY